MTISGWADHLRHHSWLMLSELLGYDWPSGLRGWWTDNLGRWFQVVAADPALTTSDLRIVFAFDNV